MQNKNKNYLQILAKAVSNGAYTRKDLKDAYVARYNKGRRHIKLAICHCSLWPKHP